MPAFEITPSQEVNNIDQVANMISEVSAREEYLSFRTVADLKRSLIKGNFLLAFDEQKLAGFIESYCMCGEWWGMFCLYVYPQYRRGGLGIKVLLEETINRLKSRRIYAAVSNDVVRDYLVTSNFREVSFYELPICVIFKLIYKYISLDLILSQNKRIPKKLKYYIR